MKKMSCVTAVVVGTMAQTAFAQPSPSPQTPAAPPAPQADETTPAEAGLEEIVVTAQRRSERLQDVPIAISAITAESLARQGASKLTDIGNVVPGLVFTRTSSAVQVYLRGIGTSSTTTGNDPTIATYIDGVYNASANSMLFSLNNIERVEVLKGPQGTLFGRNATGGLIHVITSDPGAGTTAKASIGYGNYQTVTGALYASTGNDVIAGDVSLSYTNQHKGWGRNFFDPQSAGTVRVNGQVVTLPDFDRRAGALNEFGARSKIVITPDDRTTIKLSGMYSRLRTDQGLYRHGLPGAILSGDGVTPYVYRGGFYDYDSDAPWIGRNENYLFSGEIAYRAGFATLKSITSYQDISAYVFLTSDSTPQVNAAQSSSNTATRAFTQELQLLSNGESGPDWLEYTAGLYYIHINATNEANRTTRGYFLQDLNDRFASQRTNALSAYGQATVKVTPTTRVTIGLRYSQDRLRAQQYFVGLDTTTVPLPALSNRAGQISGLVEPQTETFRKLTWRFAIDQRLAPDVMAYASVNRGFKAGQFNVGAMCTITPVGTPCPAANIAPAVKPEVLDSYEAGLKSELFDRKLRLNLSTFYYSYQNLQVSALVGSPSVTLLTNAARARIYGGEIEAIAALTRNFTLNANIGVLNSRYSAFPGAIVLVPRTAAPYNSASSAIDASGKQLVRAPGFTSTLGVNWAIPTAIGEFNWNASWFHNGGFYWDAANRVRQPAYDLVNTELALKLPGDHWKLRLWSKNLLGKQYYSNISVASSGDQGSPAAPRTFGAAVDWTF
ncbi:TonB-dependent receptor [Sphingomonas sp. MG17]|uniref:TonB-dependent receptor n=1 Tax=Sphingomonas tagetis TaxID=2949092 RepID=A0A9X2HGB4_9SPHN|nr:TonB-dependent receptor [Sphingomonas tagetis]MCP3730606.1 TonB-dependent receptor [Sphingomonas tagetis]